MGILFESLPNSVTVNGTEYTVNTSFRCMAKFEQALLTADRGDKKALSKIFFHALLEFYQNKIPPDLNEATEKMWWFYRCGEDFESKANKTGTKNRERLYDYEIDGSLIVAAFADTYGIDIIDNDLHWWLFRSYFASLGDDTRFIKIMSYRGMDLKQFRGKQRKYYAELKERYKLPVIHQTPMTLQERDEAYKRRMTGKR